MFVPGCMWQVMHWLEDRKSTRLNSSHLVISDAVICMNEKRNCSSGGGTADSIEPGVLSVRALKPLRTELFPYTTLFRSDGVALGRGELLRLRGVHVLAVGLVVPPRVAEVGGDHVRARVHVAGHALAGRSEERRVGKECGCGGLGGRERGRRVRRMRGEKQ